MTDPIRQAVAAKGRQKASFIERLMGKPADVDTTGVDPLADAVHGTELVVESVATEQPQTGAVDVMSLHPGAAPRGVEDKQITSEQWFRSMIDPEYDPEMDA